MWFLVLSVSTPIFTSKIPSSLQGEYGGRGAEGLKGQVGERGPAGQKGRQADGEFAPGQAQIGGKGDKGDPGT